MRPATVVSLWEMIDKHGLRFALVAGGLSELRIKCQRAEAMSAFPAIWQPDDPNIPSARVLLNAVLESCILTDMDDALPEVNRLIETLSSPVYLDRFASSVSHLQTRLMDDLRNEFFFHVGQRDVALYETKAPFGPQVDAKFPLAAEDIEEAAKCLALQRPTACVFHLMRAMEVVVKRLGKRLKVKNVEKEWGKILSDIGTAVSQMPKATRAEQSRRNAWSEAHANLYHVKQAWRNDTMHPKATYTREQAHEVFTATRTFMAHLAGLL